jgi:predicted nucleotidyltransferase
MSAAESFLDERRNTTDKRFEAVEKRVATVAPLLGDFATVYATGSYGRGEASEFSDLDVFILADTDAKRQPKLEPLNLIRVQAALIDALAAERLPEFSDQGAYLQLHSMTEMIEKLGSRDDDYENLFTARMLLLLESRPLLGTPMYDRALGLVIDEYWRDYEQNAERFLPIYLTNDLIRYWKVLCLNYEAKTRNTENPNKRRLTNYKLKHSRLLTCYSALLYFCRIGKPVRVITVDGKVPE